MVNKNNAFLNFVSLLVHAEGIECPKLSPKHSTIVLSPTEQYSAARVVVAYMYNGGLIKFTDNVTCFGKIHIDIFFYFFFKYFMYKVFHKKCSLAFFLAIRRFLLL